MKLLSGVVLFFVLLVSTPRAFNQTGGPDNAPVTGFRDAATERDVEKKFIAVPDPRLAEDHTSRALPKIRQLPNT